MRLSIAVLLWIVVTLGCSSFAAAEPRVALVIGNSNYGGDLGVLPNPANDARLMAKTLKGIGFTVIEAEDADQNAMKRAISDFGEKLADAGNGATGLFFYAGHGLQVGGTNYLIPIHAKIQREPDVDIEAVPADLVLKQMDFAASAVNIVILDACRNNPISRGFRSITRGLAEIASRPKGSFIAYSTAPGDVAEDGKGADSPYTTALVATMVEPGLSLNDMFQQVRGKVLAATDQKQVPWDSSSLTAPYYFIPAAAAPAPPAAAAASSAVPDAIDPKRIELSFWETIKDSKSADDFQAYLAKYPDGDFASLAKIRVKELSGSSSAASTPKAAPTGPATQAAAPDATAAGVPPQAAPAAVPTNAAVPPAPAATVASAAPAAEPSPAPAAGEAAPPNAARTVTSSAPTPEIVTVNAQLYARAMARLRSAPTSDSDVLTRLALGTALTATGHSTDGKWWRVTLPDGSSGYVAEAGVMDHPPEGAGGAPTVQQNAAKAATPTGKDSDTCKSDSGASAADRAASCRRVLATSGLDATKQYNALIDLGSALSDLGQGEAAIRSYRQAIDVDPKYYGAYYDIGMVHLNAGRYAEARAAFDKAASLKPDDPESIFQRAVALADLGEFDTARGDVERAISMKSDDGSYYDELALLQMQQGDLPAASASIDKAVSLSKDFWSGTGIFAYYLGGKLDRAIAMAELGMKEQPDYPYFWVWKALAQEAGGDVPAGRATLAEGLKAFGKHDWPAPLLEYLAGKTPEGKMRALAKTNDAKTQAERLCEISYYVGERAFLDGDKAAARAAMRQSADTRIYNYLEFFAAEARLAGLNQ